MANARSQISLILRQHGLSAAASDEVVTDALRQSGFADKDIVTALYILRETPEPQTSKLHGLHKVFRTDTLLEPAEISSLLGIDVPIKQQLDIAKREKTAAILQILLVVALSTIIGLLALVTLMYAHGADPFTIIVQ